VTSHPRDRKLQGPREAAGRLSPSFPPAPPYPCPITAYHEVKTKMESWKLQ